MSALLPHQERVVEEAADLEVKLAKLKAFLAKGGVADKRETELLELQSICMSGYLGVLKMRIAEWSAT